MGRKLPGIVGWILPVVCALFLAAPAAAQSKARAPVMDAALRQVIAAMTPLTERRAGVLVERAVVVTFFASWCPPCRPEFRQLNEVRRKFPESRLTIVAINLFENFFVKGRERRMKRFLEAARPEFAVLRARNDTVVETAFGGVDRIPTVFVYDQAGWPVHTFIHQQGATKTHATAVELTAVLRRILE